MALLISIISIGRIILISKFPYSFMEHTLVFNADIVCDVGCVVSGCNPLKKAERR